MNVMAKYCDLIKQFLHVKAILRDYYKSLYISMIIEIFFMTKTFNFLPGHKLKV